jgi:hypothetical protein
MKGVAENRVAYPFVKRKGGVSRVKTREYKSLGREYAGFPAERLRLPAKTRGKPLMTE